MVKGYFVGKFPLVTVEHACRPLRKERVVVAEIFKGFAAIDISAVLAKRVFKVAGSPGGAASALMLGANHPHRLMIGAMCVVQAVGRADQAPVVVGFLSRLCRYCGALWRCR
jgi:hypothetical protein